MKRIAAMLSAIILLCFSACADNNPTRIEGFAMDTDISVTVYGEGKYASEVLAAVTALENELSWSIDGSAVNRLNVSGEVESKTLAEIISAVGGLYEDSDGRYSLAVRELCALWDINSGKKAVPSKSAIADTLTRTGAIPTASGNIVTLTNSQAIDLGSLGKGAACDKAAEILNSQGKAGIAAIGSSLALCGDKPDGKKWSVTVASPADRNKSVGTLYLNGGNFVSTSNGEERGFEIDGKRYHHIMDAKTGYPAESDLKSVTVIASSGVLSDALSTACYIVGYEQSLELLKKYNAQAVFIMQSGDIKFSDGLEFEVAK